MLSPFRRSPRDHHPEIIPATQEEDRLKDSKVWGAEGKGVGKEGGGGGGTPALSLKQSLEEIIHLVLGASAWVETCNSVTK